MCYVLITTADQGADSSKDYGLWKLAREKGLWKSERGHFRVRIEEEGQILGEALLFNEETGNISGLADEAHIWIKSHPDSEQLVAAHDSGVYKEVRQLEGQNGVRIVGFPHAPGHPLYDVVRAFIAQPNERQFEALCTAIRRPPPRIVTLSTIKHDVKPKLTVFSNHLQTWAQERWSIEVWEALDLGGEANAFAVGTGSKPATLTEIRRLLFVDEDSFYSLAAATLAELSPAAQENARFALDVITAALPETSTFAPPVDSAAHEVHKAHHRAVRALKIIERMNDAQDEQEIAAIGAELRSEDIVLLWLAELDASLDNITEALSVKPAKEATA